MWVKYLIENNGFECWQKRYSKQFDYYLALETDADVMQRALVADPPFNYVVRAEFHNVFTKVRSSVLHYTSPLPCYLFTSFVDFEKAFYGVIEIRCGKY